MLQSFSVNTMPSTIQQSMRCCRCRQQPDSEFIILQCNHVVCVPCITDFDQAEQVLNGGIKCTCGIVTYGNTSQQTIETESNVKRRLAIALSQDKDRRYGQPRITENKINSKNNITVNIHNKSNRNQSGGYNQKRSSVGLIHSKNTASTKNISRINTESYPYSSQLVETDALRSPVNSHQTKTGLLLQKSLYPLNSNQQHRTDHHDQQSEYYEEQQQQQDYAGQFVSVTPVTTNKKYQQMNEKRGKQLRARITHNQPKFVDSESVDGDSLADFNQEQQHDKENHNNGNYSKIKKNRNKIEPTLGRSLQNSIDLNQSQIPRLPSKNKSKPKSKPQQKSKCTISRELQSELQFLKITHLKNMQSLDRTYRQLKQKLEEDYLELESNFKDICLQAIVMGQESTRVNIGKIMNLRYNTQVGSHIEGVIEQLRKNVVKYKPQRVEMERPVRFTSPQLYRSPPYAQTQYNYPSNRIQEVSNLKHRQYEPNTKTQTYSPPLPYLPGYYSSLSCQTGSKLQKRGAKKRTNIVIEL